MALLRRERGDTLLEVVFAVVIMGAVLISCASLASAAFRNGVSAKERTQAANIAQGQAEALRNLRDVNREACSSVGCPSGWAMFRSKIGISGSPSEEFCLAKDPSTGQWLVETDRDDCTAGIFSPWIRAEETPSTSGDSLEFDIEVTWEDFSGGDSKTVIATVLVSQDGLAALTQPFGVLIPNPSAVALPARRNYV